MGRGAPTPPRPPWALAQLGALVPQDVAGHLLSCSLARAVPGVPCIAVCRCPASLGRRGAGGLVMDSVLECPPERNPCVSRNWKKMMMTPV